MRTLTVALDRSLTRPLGVQLSSGIRTQVTDGRLRPGDALPSSRALARDLGVARSIVEQAYAQLVAEGWLEGRHGSGTFVAAGRAAPAARPRRRAPEAAAGGLVRLDTGTPWIDPRHAASWRRAWREVAASTPPRGYDDPRGLLELRIALAERLARLRGLDVDPDEVRVCCGTTDGLRHLLVALPPGPIGIEDPGYRAAVETVRSAGRTVRDLPALAADVDLAGTAAAYVTPAHQHPLGATMPGATRLRLLATVRESGSWVIEDDYDSEFRYDVAPVPALASLDRERVAYLGTASKSVAPSLRLGWLVAPPALTPELDRHRALTHDTAPWPVQRAYLALLREGYVDRVVRSARRVYAARAARVAEAFRGRLTGPVAGMYAAVELPRELADAARAEARRAGFEIPALSDYCRSAGLEGLVLGFGACTDDELERVLDALARVL
ncbi:MocR-like pyridoxine biosynthesis transcription factor PdxR [Nocardioides acrostichi]|uniref:PLP-dependent aminotransferase family protein n=1 Tax=Nocardioides acrostichi TaxID=2784339 RepID=A0A930YBB3_9ACTN|nr:PLP-dependent aminotransferase family protein [Nocardioides acrostichi]MBF4160314.1 PLP-dependent aminotransferase family protein [Nocardioides acrostichi]